MNPELVGGCQCKNIRYRTDSKGIALYICHCEDCQVQSGSAFGMSLILMQEEFHLTSGELKTFQITADSGNVKTCAFCPDCGVRIYNTTGSRMSIKAGTLDDKSFLTPDGQYWTKGKQSWVPLLNDVPAFSTYK